MAWTTFGIHTDPREILVRAWNGGSTPDDFHSWADIDPFSARSLPLVSSAAGQSAANEFSREGKGVLPAGLTMIPSGIISGKPVKAGLFTGTITAANGFPPDATQDFSIRIGKS